MALFHTHFFSEVLRMQSEATVILPQASTGSQIGIETAAARKSWPCLWLLHGLSDDHTTWTRRTSIERYAEEAGCAVVMPNGHRSFYADMKQGGKYWSYISEELPAVMRSFFPISDRREDNAVAGLSMGGYGAAKWLLRKPDDFIAGASLSGAVDICGRMKKLMAEEPDSETAKTLYLNFGKELPENADDDLLTLLKNKGERKNLPALLQICGTEDFLYDDNLLFKKTAEEHGYPLSYLERPGEHNWAFWEEAIQDVLAWLPEQGFGR